MQHKSRIRNELALLFFFLLFITISPPRLVQLSTATGDGRRRDQETKQRPNLVERAMGATSGTGPWEAVRSWVKLALMNPRPSDPKHDEVASTTGQVVKDAAMKSFETSKETAESMVKSAAKAATGVAHETKEKVKRTVATSGGEEHTSSEL